MGGWFTVEKLWKFLEDFKYGRAGFCIFYTCREDTANVFLIGVWVLAARLRARGIYHAVVVVHQEGAWHRPENIIPIFVHTQVGRLKGTALHL